MTHRLDYSGDPASPHFRGSNSNLDVVVIGAGPAGASTAVTLARAGLRVALLERADRFVPKVGEALPSRATVVLKSLGVWQQFVADDHLCCYGNRSAWGTSRLHEYSFIFDPYGCGWHLDRARFDAMLVAGAVKAGALWFGGTRVVGWQLSPYGWHVGVRRQGCVSTIRARFVVDASGRAATFARAQGARRDRYDRLVGLVVRLVASDTGELDTFTLVEAVADGWWYAAQLPDQKLIAVFMTDADLVSRRAVGNANGWHSLVGRARHICARVADCVLESGPVFTVATSGVLHTVVGDSWAVVGDAAATYDPLSSQGILTALENGQRVGHAVCDWLGGDSVALSAYAEVAGVRYRDYLAQRSAYYRNERRWPSSAFWHRRIGRQDAPPSQRLSAKPTQRLGER